MTKLEQVEFENIEKFNKAIEMVLNKEESFRTYEDKDKNEKSTKLIGNNNLYLGNGFSLNIVEADNKKVYVSVNYFSAEDRFAVAKRNKSSNDV